MEAHGGPRAEFTTRRTVVVSLEQGSDLLDEIERLVAGRDLTFCRLSAIGSLASARMTYYDQAAKEDLEIVFEEPMMLVVLAGTALVTGGGEVETHAHLVLANEHGVAYGGDLSSGCVVFSCELLLQELVGPPVSRRVDERTGLARLTIG